MNIEDVSVNNTEDISSQTVIEFEEMAVEKKQKKTSKKKLPTLYAQTDYDKNENIVTSLLYAFYWAGEIPTTALKIFGCYRTYAKTLRQMRKEAVYVNKVTKERITGVALKTATIKHRGGNDKILRLTETGKRLLVWLVLILKLKNTQSVDNAKGICYYIFDIGFVYFYIVLSVFPVSGIGIHVYSFLQFL